MPDNILGKATTEHVTLHLRQLSLDKRVAFSLSCAERLFPIYEAYALQRDSNGVSTLRIALDNLWAKAEADAVSEMVSDSVISDLLTMGPQGERYSARFSIGAQHVVSAVIHAYQLCGRDNLDEAIWCSVIARRCVEDYLQSTGHPYYNVSSPASEDCQESHTLQLTDWSKHPLYQHEVMKQFADLQILSYDALTATIVDRLRNEGALGIQPMLRGLIG